MGIDGLSQQLTMLLAGLSLNQSLLRWKMLLPSSFTMKSTCIMVHHKKSSPTPSDGDKNLWGGVVQKYLEKIKTLHKGMSSYHPRTNGKVKRLNGILGSMLGKMLLNKPTKLWDLYVDQAIF